MCCAHVSSWRVIFLEINSFFSFSLRMTYFTQSKYFFFLAENLFKKITFAYICSCCWCCDVNIFSTYFLFMHDQFMESNCVAIVFFSSSFYFCMSFNSVWIDQIETREFQLQLDTEKWMHTVIHERNFMSTTISVNSKEWQWFLNFTQWKKKSVIIDPNLKPNWIA